MNKSCGTCEYYMPENKTQGNCRRYPPSLFAYQAPAPPKIIGVQQHQQMGAPSVAAAFPSTQTTHYCGEWLPISDEGPAERQ